MTKIFVTGATGYIGGDALKAIIDADPEYEITALVRNSDKGAQVAAVYPKVSLVYGDLDSTDLLTKEASKADIVCHFANADHGPSATALTTGLAAHPPTHPGYLIHTSGTGILLYPDIRSGTFGETSAKIYDDLDGVSEITSLPDDAPHRPVDQIVLGAGEEYGGRVRTAIVCPPTIYGAGRGVGNRVSHQLPELCRVTLERGHGVQVGKGLTRWGNVHVHDLSSLYLKLVEEAAAGGSTAEWEGKPATWGREGYYFCENGEHVWGELAGVVAREAKGMGLIGGEEVRSLTGEEADGCSAWGSAMWGANSRGKAKRARVVLGWKGVGGTIEEDVRGALEVQARALGMVKGHAVKAAGDA
ncbi:hypothetical protein LTR35_001807 [Friedmanniomyces endolithicus]|uniref:NAD(P)-binding domain-containing protein n=1 Tax=Friedmanniomyces endolithicus TaxID=329885 RepID=A0AAN6JCU5_9PEZI|nr:hypothetical protein LTR35_001807 [Friedmanniomyces endolithicus]KAK0296893.1 hypothetical protein LTS00_004693 [Friedmanniomyces endolithicus]KAK0325386.1 hypothetical protein LTR82_003669 [Friedmanniomyces endolithicus]KAK1011109.1 hypothetical protein LTR54_005027 [Friedmanniomyces endolithicus]